MWVQLVLVLHLGQAIALGSGGRSPTVGSRGSAGKVPQKPKQFADIVYRFCCRNDQNLKSLQIYLLILDPVCFTVGAKRHFG